MPVKNNKNKVELTEEELNKKNVIKNIIITVIVIAIIVILFIISDLVSEDNVKNTGSDLVGNPLITDGVYFGEEERKEFTEVSYDEFKSIIKEKENTIVFIGRPTCSWCVYQTPVLQNVAYLYDLEIKYLNTDKLTEEEYYDFLKLDSSFSQGIGTPMLFVVGNGKLVDMLNGANPKENLVAYLEKNNFI